VGGLVRKARPVGWVRELACGKEGGFYWLVGLVSIESGLDGYACFLCVWLASLLGYRGFYPVAFSKASSPTTTNHQQKYENCPPPGLYSM